MLPAPSVSNFYRASFAACSTKVYLASTVFATLDLKLTKGL